MFNLFNLLGNQKEHRVLNIILTDLFDFISIKKYFKTFDLILKISNVSHLCSRINRTQAFCSSLDQ